MMAMENFWLGVGVNIGGSLGFGVSTTQGLLFSVSDLLALITLQPRPVRCAEVLQTTYSGMVGIDFSATYDLDLLLAKVGSDIQELNKSSTYSQDWHLDLALGSFKTAIGHSIAQLGKIDKSLAKLTGASYAATKHLANIAANLQSYSNLMNVLLGPPPSMMSFAVLGSPLSFDVMVGRKNQMSSTSIQSTGSFSLTPWGLTPP